MSEYKRGEDYHTLFDSSAYLGAYASPASFDTSTDVGKFTIFLVDTLHDIFNSVGRYLPKNASLLDVGSGPTVQYLVSSSRHVTSIILSEFAERNRRCLMDWYSSQKDAHDFSPFFKYIAEKEEIEFEAKQCEFRDKVKGIVPCNVLQSNPLYPSLFSPFDVVCSSLCMEAVAANLEEYKTLVRNVSRLLKPGGWLVLSGVLGESFYKVGTLDFYCLKLSPADIKSSWESSGFTVHTWEQYNLVADQQDINPFADMVGLFCMAARKNGGDRLF